MVSFMEATRPRVKVRVEEVDRKMAELGLTSNTELAYLMEINRSNLSRTLRDQIKPSERFIASLCVTLGASMNELFVIVEPDEERAA